MSQSVFGMSARMRSQISHEKSWHLLGAVAAAFLMISALVWWNGMLDPHESIKQMVVLLGTGLTGIAACWLTWRSEERPLPLVLWGLSFMLGIVTLISLAIAPEPMMAWLGTGGSIVSSASMTWAAVVAFLLASQLRMRGWSGYPRIAYAVFGLMVTLGWLQMSGWIDVSPGTAAAKVFSPLGNAMVVGWVSVLILTWLVWKRESLMWYEWVVMGLGISWVLVLDRSELWWTLLAMLVIGGMIGQAQIREMNKGQLVHKAVVLLMIITGLLAKIPHPQSMPSIVSPSWSQSLLVVREAWQNNWIFGSGQGQWAALYDRVRPMQMNLGERYSLRFEHGASWMATSATQEGVAGLLVRVLFFLLIIGHVSLLLQRHPERIDITMVGCAGIVALCVGMPHGWFLVGVFGWLGYICGDEYDWPRAGRGVWVVGVVLLSAASLAALVWAIPRVRADHQAYMASSSSGQDALTHITQARALSSWVAEYAFSAVDVRGALASKQLRDATQDHATTQQELARLLSEAKDLTDRWPNRAESWLMRARAYALIAGATQGADQFAIQAYQEGMKRAPQSPVFPLGIAQIYAHRAEEALPIGAPTSSASAVAAFRLEQRRLAAQWLQRALEKKPDDEGMVYLYAVNLAKSGDLSAALPLFRALVERRADRMDLRLEYATLLASADQRSEAIRLAESIPSNHELYSASRRLLTDWYFADRQWAQALGAWKQLPVTEQKTAAFRTRLRELQSKAGSSSGR